MTTVDTAGRTVAEADLAPSRFINGMCALKDRDALAASSDELGPLYTLAADGKTVAPVPLMSQEQRGREPITLQTSLASNKDWTNCVVATAFGSGLALWNGTSFTHSALYRETISFPNPVWRKQESITDTSKSVVSFASLPHDATESALGVAMTTGRVRVLFSGRSAYHGGIIDDYDDQTLAYLGSVLLPFRVGEFTAPTHDLVVVLTKQRGFPVLVALRQRARSTR